MAASFLNKHAICRRALMGFFKTIDFLSRKSIDILLAFLIFPKISPTTTAKPAVSQHAAMTQLKSHYHWLHVSQANSLTDMPTTTRTRFFSAF